jgi:predicted secreted protein
MASEGVSGIGTKFRHLVGSVWTELAEVRGISGPSKSRETIDVTSFDSIDGYREFIGSLRDAGEVTLELIFTAGAYDVLDGYFDSDDLVDFEILLSDPENTSFEFKGLVTAVPLEVPLDDAITFSCTIKVSAKVTIDSGSG